MTVTDPLVGLAGIMIPEATFELTDSGYAVPPVVENPFPEQYVAFVELQVSVDDCPLVIEVGDTTSVTVGTVGVGTVPVPVTTYVTVLLVPFAFVTETL